MEDPALVTKRVMFAYEQALLCLSHHADIWYEAASYLQESSKTLQEKGDVDNSKKWLDEASQLYERAVTGVLNKCPLLYFTYADFEEGNMNFEKVHKIYQDFLGVLEIDPTLGYIQYMKFCRRAEGIKVNLLPLSSPVLQFNQPIPSLRGTCSRRRERMRGQTSTCLWRPL